MATSLDMPNESSIPAYVDEAIDEAHVLFISNFSAKLSGYSIQFTHTQIAPDATVNTLTHFRQIG